MRKINNKEEPAAKKPPEELIKKPISSQLEENENTLTTLLQGCSDAVIRKFSFGMPRTEGLLVYFDGLADKKDLEVNLLKPLLLELNMQNNQKSSFNEEDLIDVLLNQVLSLAEIKKLDSIQEVIHHISSGDAVLFIDKCTSGLVIGSRSWASRSVSVPENEITIFGPKEGFTETIRFNTALLRRRIKTSNFKMEPLVIGRITKTDVLVCYIDGLAPAGLVKEVKSRLEKIDIDALLDTGYLAELIADHKWTIFNQFEHTEKPDRVCGHLLEGKICIMADGTPMALILPVSFVEYMISSEDYYINFIPASIFRMMRFAAFILALILPSLYVAVITYHHEMIPTPLLLTIAATRQGVPFPAFVEALLLEASFELLREAGLRLPKAVGPAVSIVGALIIGDAAVRAGLVSTPMVVVIAFTGISSFVMPSYNAGIIVRISRFGFLFASGLLGFLGIVIFAILMLLRMASLTSFGTPYLAPIAPFNFHEMGDIIIRRPWFNMKKRPYLDGMEHVVRQTSNEQGEVKQ